MTELSAELIPMEHEYIVTAPGWDWQEVHTDIVSIHGNDVIPNAV